MKVAGIQEAQTRWGVIQSRGRIRGIIALAVAVVVILAIGLLAGSNASVVAIVIVLALVAVGGVAAVIGKRKTGLALTPEWKPETTRDDYDDFDDPDGPGADEADKSTDTSTNKAMDDSADGADEESDTEPVRRLDAQMLGADLSKLGQVVSPKLAKSYSVGTLVVEDSVIAWEPGAGSQAAGIERLVTAAEQVKVVETAPLWGSWGLIRVATTEGDEWCMRVPGSVDLAPAFAELGLTVHKTG